MEQFDVIPFAIIKKSNDLDVHQRYAIEIQYDQETLAFYLCLEFIEMLRLQAPTQANDGPFLIANFFKLQCHR